MTKLEEAELFEFLARQSKFREWLDARVKEEQDILALNDNPVHIHRAQGAVRSWNRLITTMTNTKK